jgi:hypothetical protein
MVVLSSLGLMLVELGLRSSSGGAGVEERLEALREHAHGPDSRQPLARDGLQRLESLQLGHLHEQTLQLVIAGWETRLAGTPAS